MEWNQALFEIFMAAVVGNLFFISTKLAFSKKKAKVEAERRDKREDDPVDEFHYCPYRLNSKDCPSFKGSNLDLIQDPTDCQTRHGSDETPPVS